MFYFFKPTETHKSEKEILAEIDKRFKIDWQKHRYAYKFIFYDPVLEIHGCVFLHRDYLKDFLPMATLKETNPLVWIAYDLHYECENEEISECLEDFQWHYQNFFRQLYEQLTNFTITQNVDEIFTYFGYEEHENAGLFGKWLIDWAAQLAHEKVMGHVPFNRQAYLSYVSQFDDNEYFRRRALS